VPLHRHFGGTLGPRRLRPRGPFFASQHHVCRETCSPISNRTSQAQQHGQQKKFWRAELSAHRGGAKADHKCSKKILATLADLRWSLGRCRTCLVLLLPREHAGRQRARRRQGSHEHPPVTRVSP
jgi:hypothetical protein